MKYPELLLKLIQFLKKIPSVGNKSAERYAFQLLEWKDEELAEMGSVIAGIHAQLQHCTECGCLSDQDGCSLCTNERRDKSLLCVVARARDVFAIEETHEYQGHYHVLGGLLSPMDGIGPETLTVGKLKQRIEENQVRELVIAIDSTLEGDATALYLRQELGALPTNTSRLAFGLPMGSSLDYVDGGTLARAFNARSSF